MICKCENKNCSKANECFRFKHATGEIILYQNICKESNNHKWFWQVETNITTNNETNMQHTTQENSYGTE